MIEKELVISDIHVLVRPCGFPSASKLALHLKLSIVALVLPIAIFETLEGPAPFSFLKLADAFAYVFMEGSFISQTGMKLLSPFLHGSTSIICFQEEDLFSQDSNVDYASFIDSGESPRLTSTLSGRCLSV